MKKLIIVLMVAVLTANIQSQTAKNGEVVLSDGIEFVYVEGRGNVDAFYIGKFEVTQAQWKDIMGNNPSKFKGDNHPVEKVSWNDVQEFLSKLNARTGKNYRLPTLNEWEFAARGGSLSKGYQYSGSNDINAVAWHRKNSGKRTHPVGTRQPNELGIYDMSGNIQEWCIDVHSQDNTRVFRGGSSWDYLAGMSLTFQTQIYGSGISNKAIGFRLAYSLVENKE